MVICRQFFLAVLLVLSGSADAGQARHQAAGPTVVSNHSGAGTILPAVDMASGAGGSALMSAQPSPKVDENATSSKSTSMACAKARHKQHIPRWFGPNC